MIDTSVWIEYFRGGDGASDLDFLIDENICVTNDIILAELLPFLKIRRQTKVVELLGQITRMPVNIDWQELIDFQVKCLKAGANGVGIPDLLIAQNAKTYDCRVFSLDKHFRLLNQAIKLKLYER